MSGGNGLVVWDERFTRYDFGPGHPFTQRSRRLAVRLLESIAPPDATTQFLREVAPADRRTLESFHAPAYLDRVQRAAEPGVRTLLDDGDTPSFPGCFEESARIVQGAVSAVDHVIEHRVAAFHPSGGLHHAHPGAASGFCVFNDVAIAVARAVRNGRRVAYIDLDAHHGDGVMYGFYDSGKVLDIDFHQDGRTLFPGTGRVDEVGSGDGAHLKVNLPLPPGTGDEALGPLFRRVVPPLLRRFRPEVMVVQHGADGHAGDPLTALQYTSRSYDAIDRQLRELAHELCDGRLLVTGGGGYRPESVARVFACAGASALGWVVPGDQDTVSERWRAEFQSEFSSGAPREWRDPEPDMDSSWTPYDSEKLVHALEVRLGERLPDPGPP